MARAWTDRPAVAIANLLYRLRGRPCRVRLSDEPGLFEARDTGTGAVIHFCRRVRHRRYKRGIDAAVSGLARQYLLDRLGVEPGGTFVDCGANVGELGLWARGRGLSYVAVEPEPLEARCCDLNNFGGAPATHRAALWHEAGTLTFYSKPDTADGSAFEVPGASARVEVAAVRLDSLLAGVALGSGTRILKLEAEGAEPEVLEGGGAALRRFDYVVADCGYERGPSAQNTFVPVHDRLLAQGFELRHAEFGRVVAVYANPRRVE